MLQRSLAAAGEQHLYAAQHVLALLAEALGHRQDPPRDRGRYRAIQNGYEALFTSAAGMIEDLSSATRRGELARALADYTHPPVLVIDEVGYLTVGGDAANLRLPLVGARRVIGGPAADPGACRNLDHPAVRADRGRHRSSRGWAGVRYR